MVMLAVERWSSLANNDAWLTQRGRYVSVAFLLDTGGTDFLVHIHRGRIERVERGPFVMPAWGFALRAPAEAWAAFWQADPPPGSHDLLAMLRFGKLRIEGDQHVFMANLQYFKDLLALPRRAPAEGTRA
ncbi:MAG TPA: hypothetical protein VG900_10820 [Hyphomicrobiaceae bacterium]|nr:hypothetical protein [Hyphomicrobiaceae bacterium]